MNNLGKWGRSMPIIVISIVALGVIGISGALIWRKQKKSMKGKGIKYSKYSQILVNK